MHYAEEIPMAKKSSIAWSPVRSLMKSVGAQIVARDAVDYLIVKLTDLAKNATAGAMKLTGHSKRTKVTKGDLELWFQMK